MSLILYNIARVIADGGCGIADANRVAFDAKAVTLTEVSALMTRAVSGMTEHFAVIILSASGITRMILARIFPNAALTNHFAVMTRKILSVTRDFA